MRPFALPVIVSFLAPALALVLLLGLAAQQCRLNPRGLKWCLGMALVAFGLLLAPVKGLASARWLAGIADHWSVPLMAVLLSAVARRCFGIELLRDKDRRAAWVFGVVAGVALYPLAMGWGPVDPFGLGWHFGLLFVVVALVAALLLWRRNRFGIVLLAAIAAWHLGLPESGNYWDCLLDPIFFVVSLGALARRLCAPRIFPATPEH